MSDLTTDPLPSQKPLERFEQLQTDTFCEHCGYNLHGKRVERDERLGILVCRCPECGRYHPAAPRVSAAAPWMARVGTALLVFWIVLVMGVIVLAGFAFGGIAMLHLDLFTEGFECDPAGREVAYPQGSSTGAVYVDTGKPAPTTVYRARLRKIQRDSHEWARAAIVTLNLLSLGSGLTAGVLLVVFVWHWPKRRYLWMPLYPLLCAGFVCIIVVLNDYYDFVRGWAVQRAGYHALVQALAMGVGIMIGRPIARFIVGLFVPPRARQHLSFLWRVDGKTPPPVAVAGSFV